MFVYINLYFLLLWLMKYILNGEMLNNIDSLSVNFMDLNLPYYRSFSY